MTYFRLAVQFIALESKKQHAFVSLVKQTFFPHLLMKFLKSFQINDMIGLFSEAFSLFFRPLFYTVL